MKTVKMMDMGQFAEGIKEKLEQKGEIKVCLKHVLKNNGVMRCGLMVISGKNNLASTIYMEPFFQGIQGWRRHGGDHRGNTGSL